MRKKSTVFYTIAGILILVLLVGVMGLHIALPDTTYSAVEKRTLKSLPEFSVESLTNGSFMNALDDYSQDQFPARNLFMKLKTNLTLLLGNTYSQGVYYGKDGHLIEAFESFDDSLLHRTTDAMNAFHRAHDFENIYVLLVPTAVSTDEEYLPFFADGALQRTYINSFTGSIENAVILDTDTAFQEMKSKGLPIYYSTDHHWTSDAAFYTFTANAQTANWTIDPYKTGIVSNTFSGSLVSKSGFTPEHLDSVKVYYNCAEGFDYMVAHTEGSDLSDSFFEASKIDTENPYEVFFGGNEPRITIRTNAETSRTLLVFKDSYANCFIPFLAESYREITIIDPRYYADSVSSLFLQNDYTDVLYLYNASTLSADDNLEMVLSE